MATYKGIKGFTVQSLATDPVTITGASGSWASGGSLNTARASMGSANDGTPTASLAFGGNELPGISNKTEAYNGSSWTVLPTLNTSRGAIGSFGVQTSSIAVGGFTDANNVLPSAAVESWNGSAWSEITELSAQRINSAGIGASNTSGFVTGGNVRPGSPPGVPSSSSVLTEQWNGSSWTEVGDLGTALENNKAFGVVTSALIVGPSTSQSYNGSSWSTVPATLNTARSQFGAGGASATSGIIFGGSPAPPAGAVTEVWDGSSWTEVSDLASARRNLNGSGSATSALAFGGQGTPPVFSATEEFSVVTGGTAKNEGQVYYNTTTNLLKLTATVYGTGTWASGNVTNTKIGNRAFGGSQTSALLAGGNPTANNMELYDGTSWTNSTVINTGRRALAGSGTANTSVIIQGGLLTNPSALTEVWDGSSWTEVNDLNTARFYGATSSQGSVTATLYAGGNAAATELWNGSTWTEVNDLNTARTAINGAGISTSAIIAAGEAPAPPFRKADTEIWDGTSWTEVANLNQLGIHRGMAGVSSSSALCFAGEIPPMLALTEDWNGTSWTEVADMAAARDLQQAGGGTSTAAIAAGSRTAPFSGATEEWTVPESISNVTVASS